MRSVDDQFTTRADTDEESAALLRRRRIAAAGTVLAGAVALALTLRMPHDAPLFPLAALGVAAVWTVGALAGGPLHLGRLVVAGLPRRPILAPVLAGVGLAALFFAGALVTRLVPALADQARSVLGFAQSGSLALLTGTTLVSGLAEELFFRGALYSALPGRHPVWSTTAAYTVATALAGNPMLAFAAAVLGFVTALQRRSTGGVLAPMLTHVTWSLTMLHVLPHVF